MKAFPISNRLLSPLNLGMVICIMLMASAWMNAQQLPNSGFENWSHHSGNFLFRSYDQPEFWTTGNSALETVPGVSPPTRKTTDAHSGQFAAMLVTSSILGQTAPGNIYVGSFKLNITKPISGIKLGIPFVEKPTSFSIWYKYLPEDGDSCILTVYLLRRNKQTGEQETLGQGRFTSTEIVKKYKQAIVKIDYDSIYTPDSIVVVFCSSAGIDGERSTGNSGSTLFIDDFELQYDPTGIDGQDWFTDQVYPNPANQYLRIPAKGNAPLQAELIAINGKRYPLYLRAKDTYWETDISGIPSGKYFMILNNSHNRRVQHLMITR